MLRYALSRARVAMKPRLMISCLQNGYRHEYRIIRTINKFHFCTATDSSQPAITENKSIEKSLQYPQKKEDYFNVCSFRNLVKSSVFVDKTLLLERIFKRPTNVHFITAPSRFGKSVMISMVRHFMEIPMDQDGNVLKDINCPQSNFRLFENLKISSNAKFMEDHCCQYPVIYLNLTGPDKNISSESVMSMIRTAIHKEYKRHVYLKRSTAIPSEFQKTLAIWNDDYDCMDIPEKKVLRGLTSLVEMLNIYHNKKCYILIDEYDSSIVKALGRVKFTELENICGWVVGTVATLLKSQWSDEHIAGAIVTGVSYLSVCGLSRSLNNIVPKRFPMLHDFSDLLGLTEQEVRTLFEAHGMQKFVNEALYRFNGYTGKNNVSLYHPFSVFMCIRNRNECIKNDKLEDYWYQNLLVKGIAPAFGDVSVRNKISRLIAGESVYITLLKELSRENFYQLNNFMTDDQNEKKTLDKDVLYSYLAEQGFLVLDPKMSSDDDPYVLIPKQQVRTLFIKDLTTYYKTFYPIDTSACQNDLVEMLKSTRFYQLNRSKEKLRNDVSKFLNSFHKLLHTIYSDVENFENHHLQATLAIACCIEDLEMDLANRVDRINIKGRGGYGESYVSIICKSSNICMIGVLQQNSPVKEATELITEKRYMNLIKHSDVLKKGITRCFVFAMKITRPKVAEGKSDTLQMVYDVREIPEELKYCDNPELLNQLDQQEKVRVVESVESTFNC